jgi:hypothetical protein
LNLINALCYRLRATEQFVARERGIRFSQLASSGAGCVSPPAPPELKRWVAYHYFMKRILTATGILFVAIAVIAICGQPRKRHDETDAERFYRKGGKERKAEVFVDHGALSAPDIAQKRDLTMYDDGGHFNCRLGMVRYSGETSKDFSP